MEIISNIVLEWLILGLPLKFLSMSLPERISLSLLRWFVVIGLYTTLTHIMWKFKMRQGVLSAPFRGKEQWKREALNLLWSYLLVVIPLFILMSFITQNYMGHYQFRLNFSWTERLFYLGCYIVLFDIYFYLTHRLLHTSFFYRHIHHVHHQSQLTHAFTGMSFHPFETLILYAFQPLAMFFIPFDYMLLTIYSWFIVIVVTHGHSSIAPNSRGVLLYGKFLNTSKHHFLHHKFPKYNYSLLLNLWDRWFQTNSPNYQEDLRIKIQDSK